ncbi:MULTISPECIES: ATP-dependent DNA helicase RecG [unclassified Imperialibacter]|uniref:ATP-dependent DNA helicase RecG n=1 Tax=unclassified Imperialibacter TaxID=2629706 RepID=UPI0012587EC6|nr:MULTISPECIES: ATP-dependent DNA helicase RecG [unclassified Imperialibacter]CAD5267566.1 ATP-dependent DNA helicase RecG [Imperialibacter sp. 89]CAD5295994.1 ATP-dependent DNA helicase RecG [Imperialibacter sp. 75]VVT33691.1 ATP-dependent DNA helicase RecG [Imperialibacter sp. EC-SDR9]
MSGFFETRIEFLKGVGPQRAELLNKELSIFTYGDLLQHYPFRYEDRTTFHKIRDIRDEESFVQVMGKIRSMETIGIGGKKRLVAHFYDETGEMELVWFQGAAWISKKLRVNTPYLVYGKPSAFGSKFNIAHPEIELLTVDNRKGGYLQPIYHTSEKLKARFIDSKVISKFQEQLLLVALPYIHETLPDFLLQKFGLVSKKEAMVNAHFPKSSEWLERARKRLKFEELFYIQLRLVSLKGSRKDLYKGLVLADTSLLTTFYNDHLPFELTGAQKRVIREIYLDMRSGKQMNRLLQGDVGSGKTMVAFICMLLAIGSGSQATLMAPTEILAGQHYTGLKEYADKMGLSIAKLTGSTKKKERTRILAELLSGDIHILVGTHALLEEPVQFRSLGLAITDEQHRFGVAQRAQLWQKNEELYPHVLVMTATPIPRTLAMTVYGDLDTSTIDEMPAGRKPIKTIHRTDAARLQVFGFIREQIQLGRQAYIVYPLIEESASLDLKDLMDGYESIARAFPDFQLSIVHGKMKPEAKDFEMQRFVEGVTQVMVATTVIEVGINVPNASMMVIENAERFGLAQLHQLRGRVGRGADQSYCILMTKDKLSQEARTRIQTMVGTNDGFEIARVDLKLRGPGDLTGTQQSGVMDLLVADLVQDGKILQAAREEAQQIIDIDPKLALDKHRVIKSHISSLKKSVTNWSRIS